MTDVAEPKVVPPKPEQSKSLGWVVGKHYAEKYWRRESVEVQSHPVHAQGIVFQHQWVGYRDNKNWYLVVVKLYLRVHIPSSFRQARSQAQPLAWPVTLSAARLVVQLGSKYVQLRTAPTPENLCDHSLECQLKASANTFTAKI